MVIKSKRTYFKNKLYKIKLAYNRPNIPKEFLKKLTLKHIIIIIIMIKPKNKHDAEHFEDGDSMAQTFIKQT